MYVVGADLEGKSGDIELSFDNDEVFCFGVAANGESLGIEPINWPVQFPEPVSPANQEFLWTSGKWEILDLGKTVWSYRQYVGRTLSGAEAVGGNEVLLDFVEVFMRIRVVADELRVYFTRRPTGEPGNAPRSGGGMAG